MKEGKKIHGFVVNRVVNLPDLCADMYILEHQGTGAELIHLANDDDNNLFSVALRTTPDNSTGVAHILEHVVLCGSEKYPVRDPFFSMLKRSLNTFMNAFTANDWTMYPFSTRNRTDFYNLMDVYLDAVFFPRISDLSFKQEGWRLEFADPADRGSALIYKGIVYNEMKGAMSDPSSLMSRRLHSALYPATTYHNNSGGEPENIPDLTWEELKAFHARYYHPSNARFFTYGNLPLGEHLRVMDERVLSRFDRGKMNTSAGTEERFRKPKRVEYTYPFDPSASGEEMERKSMASVAWLACSVLDHFEVLSLELLSSLLLGNPAAPLYRALMDSRLGSSLAPVTGYEGENRETLFAAGLQGIRYEEADRVEELVLDTLRKVAREGFTKDRIEAVIHRAEFSNREVSGNHMPYALNIIFRMFGSWVHGGDPVSPLLISENLDRLRCELDKGRFFEEKIEKYLLDNNHRVTVILKPDPEKGKADMAGEARRLADAREKLSDSEIERVLKDADDLRALQEKKEDLSVLPTLGLEDIPQSERSVGYEIGHEEGVPVYWFDQPTNGISYFNAVVSTSSLPQDLKSYIPLFCTILTKIGAAGHDYAQMAERIEAHTGGIGASANIWEKPDDIFGYREVVEISSKSLVRKQEDMFGILSDIFSTPDFRDLKRLKTLVGQIGTSMENSIPASGHSYARGLAARHLTPAARLRESWFGIHQIKMVREIAAKREEELAELAEKMERIASCLLGRVEMQACIVAERERFDSMRNCLSPFLRGLEDMESHPAGNEDFSAGNGLEGWSANVPVSYVAQVFRAVPYTHEDSPGLQVLARLIRSSYLHREIREKGGAYGGYAAFSAAEGLFSFMSYRDPHIERTLKAYSDSIDWVMKGKFSGQDLKEAILSTFSDMDIPLSPSGRGGREFILTLRGMTAELRNRRREAILSVDRESLVRVAKRHLEGNTDSSVAVISGAGRLEQAKSALGKRLVINRI